MAFNDPIGKGEAAFVALASAVTLNGTRGGEEVALEVHPGRETSRRQAPFVVCALEAGGEEVVKGTGIWRHSGYIELSTLVDETDETAHAALVKALFDALVTDSIAADLSAEVADYHVYDVTWQAPSSMNDGLTTSRLPFQIVHCCSDLT